MLAVVLIVLAIAAAWAAASVALALIAGGMIHARDHRDTPFGGARRGVVTPIRVRH